jgi:hypothetical protein
LHHPLLTKGNIMTTASIKRHTTSRINVLLALFSAIFLSFLALPALAQTSYVNANGVAQNSPSPATTLTGAETTLNDTGANTGWYLCDAALNYANTLTISGDVNLILGNACDLTVTGYIDDAGINVIGANSLTVWAQSAPSTGRLTANAHATDGDAGIGGGIVEDGGTIEINGGTVRATGTYGAGIGGGDCGDGGNITINGGTVTAIGSGGGGSAAGIGGGGFGAGGNITINGSANVAATGGAGSDEYGGGAGIGSGGTDEAASETVGTITINTTGTVTATGGATGTTGGAGAAIGRGGHDGGDGAGIASFTHPANQTVTAGQTAAFSFAVIPAAGGLPASAYQWQFSAGGAFADVTDGVGGTTADYTTVATTVAMSGNEYRSVMTASNVNGDTTGTITITSHAAALTVGAAPHVDLSHNVTPSNPYLFAARTVGYGAITPLTVTVSNNGNIESDVLAVSLTGAGFTITNSIVGSRIQAGDSDSFEIAPNHGLGVGTHTATVEIIDMANNSTTSFIVSFTVNATPLSSTASIPTLNPAMLVLLAFALTGLAIRRKSGEKSV